MGLFLELQILILPAASAQSQLKPQPITFKSLTATYHLSRDSQNHSLLTTEEVILADFPGTTSYYGITRSIPRSYQGRSVDINIKNVTDGAGQPVPFKTANDKTGNLVVTTGDPAIAIYGLQTFRLNYQTKDVIDINSNKNEFLLNVNGRGWGQPFEKVTANIHIPASFRANLITEPTCYLGYNNQTSKDCSLSIRKLSSETIIDSKSNGQVAAHQALIIKMDFKADTFSHDNNYWQKYWYIIISLAVLASGLLLYRKVSTV